MTQDTLISVIIPTYNAKAFIADAVESALAQTYRNIEILVVDDGSVDGTGDLLKTKYGARIKYLYKQNGGPASARNIGIKSSRGEFIAFLDADDIWMPGKLALQVQSFRDRVVMVGFTHQTRNDGAVIAMPFEKLVLNNLFLNSGVMVRRSVIERAGAYDERPEFRAVEDWDMWLRLTRFGELLLIQRDLIVIRITENSLSAPGQAGKMLTNEIAVLKKHLEGQPVLYCEAISGRYFSAAWAYSTGGQPAKALRSMLACIWTYPFGLFRKRMLGILFKMIKDCLPGARTGASDMLRPEEKPGIPKIIWMLWFQGLDNAPEVVKACYASWQRCNPGWEIRFLDETTLIEYVDLDAIIGPNRSGINKQALSDILRINLLAQHGGVWIDATCFCCQPLDRWIDAHATEGFFAFSGPGRDRLFDSWFLASTKGCYLTVKQCEAVNNYFRNNRFNYDNIKKYSMMLEAVVETHRLLTWISFIYPVRKVMGIYPYFWFHYLFAETIRKDKECGRIWGQAGKVSARGPHLMQFAGLLNPMRDELKPEARRQFLHKLSWKYDQRKYRAGCILDYILHSG